MDGTRLEQLASSVGIGGLDTTEAMRIFQFAQLVADEAAKEEREACAKACFDLANETGGGYSTGAWDCAVAIRERSNVY